MCTRSATVSNRLPDRLSWDPVRNPDCERLIFCVCDNPPGIEPSMPLVCSIFAPILVRLKHVRSYFGVIVELISWSVFIYDQQASSVNKTNKKTYKQLNVNIQLRNTCHRKHHTISLSPKRPLKSKLILSTQ